MCMRPAQAQAADPGRLPGGRSNVALNSRPTSKLPPGRQRRTVPDLLWLPCCAFLFFPPRGTLLPLLSSLLLGPGRCRSLSWCQVEKRSGLPRAWRSVLDRGLSPPPQHPTEPEPSGRDLGGGWEETAPGKVEGVILGLTGPRGVTFLSCGPSPLINGTEAEEGKRKPLRSAPGKAGPSKGPAAPGAQSAPGCVPPPQARSG